MAGRPLTPASSTYRVQLHAGFDFDDAAALVPYLARLGITHLYCSPYLQAAPGSTHGYDVVDPLRVNEELGGAAGHARLVAALDEAGLGHVIDLVPNHMAADPTHNRWWRDVLTQGRRSEHASWFDIEWDASDDLEGKVLLAVLPDTYEAMLDRGAITLERRGGTVVVHAGAVELPSDPMTLDRLPDEPADLAELDTVLVDEFVRRQPYRLSRWTRARTQLNYRRFFDVDGLVGVRVEHDDVFSATHALVVRWATDGTVDGLRVDHPDGLRDPGAYLDRLRKAAPEVWIGVEKILEPGEELVGSWPVDGTTGYDFAALVTGVLIDPDAREALIAIAARFTGEEMTTFVEVARQGRHDVLRTSLVTEERRLTSLFAATIEATSPLDTADPVDLRAVITETLADFEVYRTYVDEDGHRTPFDEHHIAAAIGRAQAHRPDLPGSLFATLAAILRGDAPHGDGSGHELRMRFQQVSGAVMAKGVEDTAFYRWLPLLAANEVGGRPESLGIVPADLHEANRRAVRDHPRTMLALSTHDTKRSEDVRARLAVLSEIPEAWELAVRTWHEVMADHPDRPDPATELYLYQTLVGAHPLPSERAVEHLRKAVREAKRQTSWLDPDEAYEERVVRFTEAVLADRALMGDVASLVRSIDRAGRVGSLTQKLLQLVSPGIADTYQGTELWDLSLTDPDNRRPVDVAERVRLLEELDDPDGADLDQLGLLGDDGRAKLHLISRGLRLRRDRPELFGVEAGYEPIHARGAAADHVVAIARGAGLVGVAPRLVHQLADRWVDTELDLPPGSWHDVLAPGPRWSGTVRLSDLLGRFPVALLVGDGAGR